MPLLTRERTHKSQIGFQVAPANSGYTQAAGDISFANGQMIFLRFPTIIPPGSLVSNATIKFCQVVKNAGTTQQSLHQIRAEASGNSPRLVPGAEQWTNRAQTSAMRQFVMTWTAGSSPNGEPVFWTENITNVIQEVVSRSDWAPGGYITLMILCVDEQGSDMGVRANNDFFPSPQIDIEYTTLPYDTKYTVNMLENSEFNPAINGIDGSGLVGRWAQNTHFGAFVDPANQGSMAVDTSFTRLPGIPALKFTTGTPPSDTSKRTGPTTAVRDNTSNSAVFCGWLYIPSSIPQSADFWAGDPFRGGAVVRVTTRDKWVPFCTLPDPIPETPLGVRYWSYGVANYQAGWNFWLSEPAMLRSDFQQMPFNGLTPDRYDGKVDHQSGPAFEQSVRVHTPRRYANLDGSYPRAYPTWRRNEFGLMELMESVKGGPTFANMSGARIANYDPVKAIAEY